MDSDKLKSLIDDGSELVGGAVGAALGFFAAGPAGAAGFATGGYLLSKSLKKIGVEIYERVIGNREKVRIGAATISAADMISEYINSDKSPRADGFFDQSEKKRSDAEELLEGVLLKSRDSYQELKVKHYGYFYANLAFDDSISSEEANYLLNVFEGLTYRQLCLLWLFESEDKSNLRNYSINKTHVNGMMWTILQEIYGLTQFSLARFVENDQEQPIWGLGVIIPARIFTTRLGKNIIRLFNLVELDQEEVRKTISLMQ